jgi:hypothetical protein
VSGLRLLSPHGELIGEDILKDSFRTFAAGCAIATIVAVTGLAAQAPGAGGAAPQGAPGAAAAQGSSAVANPTYVSILMEKNVNRPAAEVWARVGKYCDIAEWLRVQCMITAGKDGELGAVRSLANGGIKEILVGKTDLSYTYTQPVAAGRPYNLYHGTVEIKPLSATTSKIVYTLMWDNSMLADDAARDRDKTQRTTQFTTAVENMKILAEGGTLPAAPARGGGGGGAGAGGPGGPGGPGGGRRGQ